MYRVLVPVDKDENRALHQAKYVAGLPGAGEEVEGVSVERVSVGGEVARKILDTAEELDADCLIMGGRKRSGVQKVLLGSTVQDVILSTERPVTITGQVFPVPS